jgi:hypothetical protein
MSGNQNQQGWTSSEAPVDWDGISDEPPPLLDAGIYRIKVDEAKAEPTRNQLPCVQLQVTALAGLNGESVDGRQCELRYQNLILTSKAAFRAKQFCNAAGCKPPASFAFAVVEAWASELPGTELIARIKHGQPNKEGRIFAQVDKYMTAEQAAEAAAAGQTPADAAPPRRKKRA